MTDKEKAEYYDQWHEYFEPLARIRSEVVKGLSDAKKDADSNEPLMLSLSKDEYMIWWMKAINIESATEIDNLIQTMLNEIESNDT